MEATLRKLQDRRDEREGGFTLVELLVVVVIIGVLVAIAIPMYLNYRQGAAERSAESDVRGAISAIEQFYSENSNTYPVAANNNGTPGTKIDLKKADGTGSGTIPTSPNNKLSFVLKTTTPVTYVICGQNSDSSKVYVYRSADGGSVKVDAAIANTGACT